MRLSRSQYTFTAKFVLLASTIRTRLTPPSQQRSLWRFVSSLSLRLRRLLTFGFAGYKTSGWGRELGSYGLDEYTSVKAVHWNYGDRIEFPAKL